MLHTGELPPGQGLPSEDQMIFFKSDAIEQLQRDVRELKYEVKNLDEKYWKLYHKHHNLVNSLSLREVIEPAKTMYLPTGKMEKK